MRVFHCDHCGQLVFFENSQCMACRHKLAFLPDAADVAALTPADNGLWHCESSRVDGQTFRLCRNYTEHDVCNWAVSASDSNPLCGACRLTSVIPNLDDPRRREAWFLLAQAKRRLVYSLMALGLPVEPKTPEMPQGLTFHFLADDATAQGGKPILTGHADGVITINIAEADDVERERRRALLQEPYRTLLGHFRHEVGHYYWDRLIRDTPYLSRFRELFGDERQDYAAALQQYYSQGPLADWQSRFVSAYASGHPWEDWAESWAHYLHLTDTLETAAECGLALLPKQKNGPTIRPRSSYRQGRAVPFDDVIADWFGVTYLLNNLNRGLGQKDGYPFVLPPPAIEKLRFIHEVCDAKPVATNEPSPPATR